MIMLNKHAYLVMAHNQWSILRKQLELLDDEKHDFYIHIDKKVKTFPKDICSWVTLSKVYIFQSINVLWADFSQIECELMLLREAVNRGTYTFFHLLSGTDLPIKSKDKIHRFFEDHRDENFIGIVPKEVFYSIRRVKYYHPFTKCGSFRKSKSLKLFDRVLEHFQRMCFINRLRGFDYSIIDGWQWFSINSKFAEYILERSDVIKHIFQLSIASDELAFQTMAFNSRFRKTLYDESDLKKGSMRYIDWHRGKPYTWGQEENDYSLLLNSPYMFARKFDENHIDIVNKIYDELSRRND